MSKLLGARIEGYRKTDAPAAIANRFAELVAESKGRKWTPRAPRTPKFKNSSTTKLPVKGGHVWIDNATWSRDGGIRTAIETHSGGLIVEREGKPATAIPSEEFANKDSELVACDVECRLAGIDGFYLELDVPGLGELIGGAR
jgi:hypothetical protein